MYTFIVNLNKATKQHIQFMLRITQAGICAESQVNYREPESKCLGEQKTKKRVRQTRGKV